MKRQKRTSSRSSDCGYSLGGLFRYFREEAGVTQDQLAEAAHVGVRTIRSIETDEKHSIRTRGKVLIGLNELRLRADKPPVVLGEDAGRTTLIVTKPSWLQFPQRKWLRSIHGPGALLTADYCVVPYHGTRSLDELERLVAWCGHPDQIGVRIYKGEGGMGKTRLAIELCHRLAVLAHHSWNAGFADLARFPTASVPWQSLPDLRKPLLIVVDYAGEEEKTRMVSELLLHAATCAAPKLRLLFLERDDFWLDRLHENRAAREILHGPLLSRSGNEEVHSLLPVAASSTERAESLRFAARAFGKQLDLRTPAIPELNLKAGFYRSVLFLHMHALLAVLGSEARSRDAILRQMLARERDYWKKRLVALGLARTLLPAMESAVFRISKQNGVATEKLGLELLRKIGLCRDQPESVLLQLLRALRECYPQGAGGIGSLQPDELKLFLMSRFMDRS